MPDLSLNVILDYIKRNYALIIRYGVSGLSGVFANLIVFTFAVEIYGVWYMYAAVMGFVAAYIVTFTMHKFWTFSATAMERMVTQGWLYLLSALGTLVINSVLLFMQVEWLGLWPIVAQAVALFITAALSFVFTSQVTFHHEEDRLEKFYRLSLQSMKGKWFVPILLVLCALSIMSIRQNYMPVFELSDAPQYIETAKFIAGDEATFYGMRFLKPLAPGVVAFLAALPGVSYETAVLLQAQLAYIALLLALYWFGREFFGNKKQALLLALLVGTTYPMLRYGLMPIIESGAWALYFATLASLLRWSKTTETQWLWLTCGLLLAGVLWKEYAVLAGLAFGLVILSHPNLSLKRKAHAVLQGTFLILIPWALWQWHVYDVFSYSYLDWLAVGSAGEAYDSTYTFRAVVKTAFMLLTLAWPFVFLAWWKRKELSAETKRFWLTLLIPSFGFLLWGYVSSRLFFSLVPLIAPLAVLGLSVLPKMRYKVAVVVCIGIINLGLVWLGYQPEIREKINAFTYGDNQRPVSEVKGQE